MTSTLVDLPDSPLNFQFDIDRTVPGTRQVVRFTIQFTTEGPQVIAGVREEGVDFTAISIADLPPFTSSSKQAEVLATLQQSAIACIHGKVHFLPDPLALYRKWQAELTNPQLAKEDQQRLSYSIDRIAYTAKTLEVYLGMESGSKMLKKLPLIGKVVDGFEKEVLLTEQAILYQEIGLKYESLSNYLAALACHQYNLNIGMKIKDRGLLIGAYCTLGNTYYRFGEHRKAIEFYEKLLDITKEIKDLPGQGQAYGNLGNVYNSLGEYNRAVEFHQQQLEIAKKTEDLRGQGTAHGNLGIAYQGLGKYSRAMEFHQQQLEIARKIEDLWGQGSAYANLGVAYQRLGEHRRAIELYEKHLEIAQKTEDLPGQGKAYSNLGSASLELGEYQRAIELYEKALEIAEKTEDLPGQGDAYGNLGIAYQELGKYQRAIELYEKHLEIAQKTEDLPGQGRACGNLGVAYNKLGKYEQAIELHKKHLEIAQKTENLADQGKAYGNLGSPYKNQGEYGLAIGAYKKSIAIYTKLQQENTEDQIQRGIAFFETLFHPFRDLEGLLITEQAALSIANPLHEALSLADSGRSRALAGILAKKFGGVIEPLSVDQMQAIAEHHQTVFLLYSCSADEETKAWVWVIPPRGKVTHHVLDLTPMQEEMKTKDNRSEHLQTVRGNSDRVFLEVASWVTRSPWVPVKAEVEEKSKVMRLWYKCLIEPIEDKLPRGEGARLTIVPDAVIGGLPFSLFRGETGKTLLERYTLSTVPSIQTLTLLDAIDQKKSSIRNLDQACIVANPEGSWLMGAEKEGKAVVKHFSKAKLLMDDSATLTKVKQVLPEASFIHLACHGLTVDEKGNPIKENTNSVFQGCFQLARSTLYAEDFLSTPLNAKLAVLSACQSGKGSLLKEGVVGPIHALLAAGASTVVGTRWAIDDQATRLIIEQFYHFYFNETPESQKAQAEGRLFGAAEALREALLFAKQEAAKGNLQSPDPYDPDFTAAWGAFFLVGLSGK